MEWEITIHNDPKYAEIITSGIADKEGSLGMAKAIIETMKNNRLTKALVDHSKVEKFEGNNFDIFKRPGIMKVFGAIMNIRIAEIIQPEHKEIFEFLEFIFLSQGLKFKCFKKEKKQLSRF